MRDFAKQIADQTDPGLTTGEAAKILGVDIKTVRRHVDEQRVRARRVGRHLRLCTDDVLKLAEFDFVSPKVKAPASLTRPRRRAKQFNLMQ